MRPTAAWTPAQRQCPVSRQRQQPAIPWHVPVDDHYADWVEQHRQNWQTVPVTASDLPQQPYLREDTPAGPDS